MRWREQIRISESGDVNCIIIRKFIIGCDILYDEIHLSLEVIDVLIDQDVDLIQRDIGLFQLEELVLIAQEIVPGIFGVPVEVDAEERNDEHDY